MNDYLEKILKGRAINYEAFLKKLPDALRRRHREQADAQARAERGSSVRRLGVPAASTQLPCATRRNE